MLNASRKLATTALSLALSLMTSIAFCLVGGADHALAGDKIGNGGGVWVCQGAKLEIYNVLFLDVFEAKRELQLTLPERPGPYLETLKLQKDWISKSLADSNKVIQDIEYVEKNITWIDDVIITIPDADPRISPDPSTCNQGEWKMVQLVNFTEDSRILVRRALFESSYLSNLDRTAVYLHEGIYSYLRKNFGDTKSVRARAIVGLLLSDLPDVEKVSRIQKVLGQALPVPDPVTPPTQSWYCGVKPESRSALYTAEDVDAHVATEAVIKACLAGQNPMPPGFPGVPGFPGGPGGGFGPQQNCKAEQVLCEPILSSVKNKTCSISDSFSSKVYSGQGRTRLEAQKEAMKVCMATEAADYKCYDGSSMSCN